MNAVEVKTENLDVKTRRSFVTAELNGENNFIRVHYREVRYHEDTDEDGNTVEIELSTETKTYSQDFKSWSENPVGVAVLNGIDAELAKDEPASTGVEANGSQEDYPDAE